MNYLNITVSDVKAFYNPKNDARLHIIGENSNLISEVEADKFIKAKTDYVLSRIPEKYRLMLMGFMNGELCVDCATEGQTSFSLAFKNPTNIRLFKNIFEKIDEYDLRNYKMAIAESEYELEIDEETDLGTITLDIPLKKGDYIVCDYNHNGTSNCESLRNITMSLVVYELMKSYPGLSSKKDVSDDYKDQAYLDLSRISKGTDGIPFLDSIKRVAEMKTRNGKNSIELQFLKGLVI